MASLGFGKRDRRPQRGTLSHMFGKRGPTELAHDHAQAPTAAVDLLGPEPEVLADAAYAIGTQLHSSVDESQPAQLETLMGTLAALAGEFALKDAIVAERSELPLPGMRLSGGLADRLIFSGELDGMACLWPLVRKAAIEHGARACELPDLKALAARADAAALDVQLPLLSVPAEHHPSEWAPLMGARQRSSVLVAAALFGLSRPRDVALALAHAMAMLLKMSEGTGSTAVLAHMAAETMIGASRIGPQDELGSDLTQ